MGLHGDSSSVGRSAGGGVKKKFDMVRQNCKETQKMYRVNRITLKLPKQIPIWIFQVYKKLREGRWYTGPIIDIYTCMIAVFKNARLCINFRIPRPSLCIHRQQALMRRYAAQWGRLRLPVDTLAMIVKGASVNGKSVVTIMKYSRVLSNKQNYTWSRS